MVAAVFDEREQVLYPAQFDFVADPSRWVAFVAGRNAGKTFAGSWKAVEQGQRGGLGIIAAPDFPMLEFGAKRAFIDRLREMRVPFEMDKQRGVLSVPMWDAEVRFATLETEGRVRGPNYRWGWVDEVEYAADPDIWRALKGAVRAGEDYQLFVTTTPKGRRLVYEEWVANATPRHALHRASTFDNPHIDAADYVAGLGYAGRFYRQEIEASFEAFEGLVYPEWQPDRMVAVDCSGWDTVMGVDIGTRNPTAILTVRVRGDGRAHVERELYRRNMGAGEIVAAIRAEADRCQPDAIYIDPSAAGYVLDLERDGYPVVKADNDRKRGVQLVATAIADGLTADPDCAGLAEEFGLYRYPDGGRTGDDPIKEHDHALDALRYACVGVANPAPRGGVW